MTQSSAPHPEAQPEVRPAARPAARQGRIRYFPGPRVWALAQDAYLQGESAGSIAERLGLTVNGIRKRAARKGWTRTQAAEAMKRAEHPGHAMRAVIARIGQAIHEHRFDALSDLIREAGVLARALHAVPPEPPVIRDHSKEEAWRAEESRKLEAFYFRKATEMAHALLTDRGYPFGDGWALSALHWRADILGPEQAERDFAQAVNHGVASRYWDANGRLRPIPEPEPIDAHMMRQHGRLAG